MLARKGPGPLFARAHKLKRAIAHKETVMRTPVLRSPADLAEARKIQEALRTQVVLTDEFDPLRVVAGVDVGYEDEGKTTRAAVVLLTWPDLVPFDASLARLPTSFPYIPGYLSFRELPAIFKAFEALPFAPQIAFVDGMGVAHPRGLGIASHLGVALDLPTIGVGKSRLIGSHSEVPTVRGARVPLIHRENVIGEVVRTKIRANPLYLSCGHRVCLETAVDLVLECLHGYRLPEPTRMAHMLASSRLTSEAFLRTYSQKVV